MRRIVFVLLVCALSVSFAVAQDAPQSAEVPAPDANLITLTQIDSGYDRPLFVTHAGDGSGRLFMVEQSGRVWVLHNNVPLETPFLDVSQLISPELFNGGYSERGLLGLAFHPNYADNGLLFVNYTDQRGASVVARYQVSDDPDQVDATSGAILMTVEQPYANHNGGHLEFGPDGYLYISLGDGGSAGDPLGNAQNRSTLLGTILRVDVDNGTPYSIPADNPFVDAADAAAEIWLYGIRNSWRFSFDSVTNDLYVADVGQNRVEEVNFIPAGQGGLNLGWNIMEGSQAYSGAPITPDLLLPIAEYPHSEGISVTGGYVYRGANIPSLYGAYIYGDFATGTIWTAFRDEAGEWVSPKLINRSGRTISSFGVDEAGELYLVDYGGTLFQFTPTN